MCTAFFTDEIQMASNVQKEIIRDEVTVQSTKNNPQKIHKVQIWCTHNAPSLDYYQITCSFLRSNERHYASFSRHLYSPTPVNTI